jgi:hypothetical protein
MAPRRWGWIASSTDSAGRPYVQATGPGQNVIAVQNSSGNAEANVGEIQGIPVYVDANIPLTYGSPATSDVVMALVTDDIYLWSSPLQAEAFTQPYASTLQVYFRLHAYHAAIPQRYLASLGVLTGTGLVVPAFAG